MKLTIRILASLAGVCCLCAAVAQADIFMKQSRHTEASRILGGHQPETNQLVQTWLGQGVSRADRGEESTMILRTDKKTMYMLNHAKKSYVEVSLDINKVVEEKAADAEEKSAKDGKPRKTPSDVFKGIGKAMSQTTVVVTETDEKMKIGRWNCRKYMLEMDMQNGKSSSEVWATEDTKVDPAMYWSLANSQMATLPGFENVVREMKKIKGIVVRKNTVTHIMGQDVKSSEELLEIDEKAAPAGTYDVPADYKKSKGR